jgi:hypothetical protein
MRLWADNGWNPHNIRDMVDRLNHQGAPGARTIGHGNGKVTIGPVSPARKLQDEIARAFSMTARDESGEAYPLIQAVIDVLKEHADGPDTALAAWADWQSSAEYREWRKAYGTIGNAPSRLGTYLRANALVMR